jgi:dUTPase
MFIDGLVLFLKLSFVILTPRSGLAWKHSIDVDASVIDADYRGPVGVNRSSKHSFWLYE